MTAGLLMGKLLSVLLLSPASEASLGYSKGLANFLFIPNFDSILGNILCMSSEHLVEKSRARRRDLQTILGSAWL